MTLVEYLKRLAYMELSNSSAVIENKGVFKPERIPVIVNYINEGLLRLYGKFVLKTNSIILECNEWQTRYHLSSKHSWLNSTESDKDNPDFSDKFITDDPEHPFCDDLIKILEVCNSAGRKLPLNNGSDPESVFTPVFDVLELNHPLPEEVLSIVYQAKHAALDFDTDPNQEINLPDFLYGALGSYVAYQLYSNMNTQEAVGNAQKYFQQYNQIIQDIVSQDLTNTSYSQTNTKFNNRGFV